MMPSTTSTGVASLGTRLGALFEIVRFKDIQMFMALQMEDRYPITDIFDQTPPIPPTCQWAMFLRNHDELTLEMVTDEERDYMYNVYAKDPKAKIILRPGQVLRLDRKHAVRVR